MDSHLVNTVKVNRGTSLLKALDDFQSSAAGKMACNYGACVEVPQYIATTGEEMRELVQGNDVCFFSLRLGMNTSCADNDCGNSLNEEELYGVLKSCRNLGALPRISACTPPQLVDMVVQELLAKHSDYGPEVQSLSHSENAEAHSIQRACLFAFRSGFTCPLLMTRLHSRAAMDCFNNQQRKCHGLLFGQTTVAAIGAPQTNVTDPDHVFTYAKDWTEAAGYVSSPPLRPDLEFGNLLINNLSTTGALSVCSGHHGMSTTKRTELCLLHKADQLDGVTSVGGRLAVLWHCGVDQHRGLDVCAFVRAVSTDPARLLNIYPRKGRIAVGSDADLVVWSRPNTLEDGDTSAQLWKAVLPENAVNIFSNLKITSKPDIVLLNGHLVVRDGKITNEGGICAGQWVKQTPFGCFTFSRVSAIEKTLESEYQTVAREPYTGDVFLPLGASVNEQQKKGYYFRKEQFDNIPKGEINNLMMLLLSW